jgi:hypothetical protein
MGLLKRAIASAGDTKAAIPEGTRANLFQIDFSDAEGGPAVSFAEQCRQLFVHPNVCIPFRNRCLKAILFSAGKIDGDVLEAQLQAACAPACPGQALRVRALGASDSNAAVRSFLYVEG